MPSELKTPLILEIATENFVDVISILTVHGYRVVARAESPSRHVLRDEVPVFDDDPPRVA